MHLPHLFLGEPRRLPVPKNVPKWLSQFGRFRSWLWQKLLGSWALSNRYVNITRNQFYEKKLKMVTTKIFFSFFPLNFFFILDPMNLRAKDGNSCDSQCIGGCFKGGSRNECYACRQVLYEFSEVRNNQSKNCIQECPDGFLLVSIEQFLFFGPFFPPS